MTTILLKDNSLRLLATQRLAQGRHPYYASCIVCISLVFFGDGIKLPQILFAVAIHGITLARLTLILKVTSTEKYDVRRLKPF